MPAQKSPETYCMRLVILHTHIHTYIYIYIYMYVCVYVCVCVCIYIYIRRVNSICLYICANVSVKVIVIPFQICRFSYVYHVFLLLSERKKHFTSADYIDQTVFLEIHLRIRMAIISLSWQVVRLPDNFESCSCLCQFHARQFWGHLWNMNQTSHWSVLSANTCPHRPISTSLMRRIRVQLVKRFHPN